MMMKMRYFISLILVSMSTASVALPEQSSNLITHSELTRVITGLLSVLLIIICLSWVVKRLNVVKLSTSKGFQSIATMNIGPKEKIMLLKVGGRYLLMGVGASTVNLLHDFGEHLPPGFDSDNKPRFAEILKSAVRKS